MTNKQIEELWDLRGRVKKMKSDIRAVNSRNALTGIDIEDGRIRADVMFGHFYLSEQNGDLVQGISAIVSLLSNVTRFEFNESRTELEIGFKCHIEEQHEFTSYFVRDPQTNTWTISAEQAA